MHPRAHVPNRHSAPSTPFIPESLALSICTAPRLIGELRMGGLTSNVPVRYYSWIWPSIYYGATVAKHRSPVIVIIHGRSISELVGRRRLNMTHH